ncbi:MAG: hypothetical protein V9G15_12860 [Dermatophilaceae bacterium]
MSRSPVTVLSASPSRARAVLIIRTKEGGTRHTMTDHDTIREVFVGVDTHKHTHHAAVVRPPRAPAGRS